MQIKIDALQDTIQRLLKDYGEEAVDAMEKAGKQIAKQAKKELKAKSPTKSGKYSSGWTYRVVKKRLQTSVNIYNTKKPGLTHLLENGHATRNGTGRIYPDTPAHPHIEEVNTKAQIDYVDAIEAELGF